MTDKFEFEFTTGLVVQIVVGEDGYNVTLSGGILENPLMGTFTDFKHLIHGIGNIVVQNCMNNEELDAFAMDLDLSLSSVYMVDDITRMLLNA